MNNVLIKGEETTFVPFGKNSKKAEKALAERGKMGYSLTA